MEFVSSLLADGLAKARVTEKKKEGSWKDVRAYDSSDLEQWVEQSLPGQAWLPTRQDPDAERPLARQVLDRLGERGDSTAARLAVQFGHRGREAQARFRLAKGPKINRGRSGLHRRSAGLCCPVLWPRSAELEPYRYQILVSIKLVSYRNLQAGRGRSFQ